MKKNQAKIKTWVDGLLPKRSNFIRFNERFYAHPFSRQLKLRKVV